MKISLHIEADSADEFRSLLAALGAQPTPALPTAHEVATTLAAIQASGEPKPAEPEVPVPAPTPQPAPAPAEPTEPEEPVAAKKPRGRPRKAAAVEPVPAATGADTAAPAAPAVAAAQPAESPIIVTREDLMKTFSDYVTRYGTNNGYVDVSNLLKQNFGDSVRKSSDVSDENLAKATAIVRAAITENPFNRKVANA